jgi:hypothetical protein
LLPASRRCHFPPENEGIEKVHAMIDQSNLPSWLELFARLGLPNPRRGRAACAIHGGDSRYSLSLNENKGVFYCHACHAHGNKIDFLKATLGTNFGGALQWLGIEPGRPPIPDSAILQQRRIDQGLKVWAANTGRKMRGLFRAWSAVESLGRQLLLADAESESAWELLKWSGYYLQTTEEILDRLDSKNPEKQFEAYLILVETTGA